MRSWLRREIQPLFTWPRPMSERDFQIPFRAATELGPYLELRKWNRQRIFATSIVREIEMKSRSKYTRLFSKIGRKTSKKS